MKEKYTDVQGFMSDIEYPTKSILICGPAFASSSGIAHSMNQQAKQLVENGYEVEILCFNSDMEPPEGVHISQFGWTNRSPYTEVDKVLSLISGRALRILRKMRQSDVVIAHRFPFTLFGWIASEMFGKTYILWSWPSGPSMDEFTGLARVWAHIQHYFETSHISVRDATYICSISDDSREYISQKTGRDTITIPFNIDNERLSNEYSEQEINENLGVDSSTTIVLYVGRITPRKNVLELIKSFEAVREENTDIKLLIVGEKTRADYSNKLNNYASKNVNFLGYIDDGSYLGAIYERSDVYATCSRSEGWSIPVAEAKYFDTPVVAFDSVPAAQELEQNYIVSDGNYDQFQKQLRKAIE